MLLRWVLTRDEEAVFKMLDDYGSFEPSLGGKLVRTVAETWRSVSAAYSHTNSDYTRRKDKFENEVNQRQDEIYAALRSGKLRSWVSRDKSGHLVPGEQAEWMRRQFFSLDGHDLVVPLWGSNEIFGWGRHFEITETVCGDAPLPVPSTVWMDPGFSAADAQHLWPRVTNGDFKSVEDRFVQWMEAQKKEFGRYPPRSRTRSLARPGFEEWAQQAGIRRDLVRHWVKKHGLSHLQGAPRKNLAKK